MKFTTRRTVLLVPVLLLVANCAHYKGRPLRPLPSKTDFYAQDNKVSFNYKPFTKSDCKYYLSRNVIKKGYRPIQISIENNTDRHLSFAQNNLSVKTMPADIVAERSYFSIHKRALGYGITGIFFWPFIIPAIVDSCWADEENPKLLSDYLDKEASDRIIEPNSKLEGLIFVPLSCYRNNISVTLIDTDSQEKIVCKKN